MKVIKDKHLAKGAVTVDSRTGKVTKSKVNFSMLPAQPGTCEWCAEDHKTDQPHNAQSLFYQYRFYNEHGRWPTWKDALKHCSKKVRALWISELERHGVKV